MFAWIGWIGWSWESRIGYGSGELGMGNREWGIGNREGGVHSLGMRIREYTLYHLMSIYVASCCGQLLRK